MSDDAPLSKIISEATSMVKLPEDKSISVPSMVISSIVILSQVISSQVKSSITISLVSMPTILPVTSKSPVILAPLLSDISRQVPILDDHLLSVYYLAFLKTDLNIGIFFILLNIPIIHLTFVTDSLNSFISFNGTAGG